MKKIFLPNSFRSIATMFAVGLAFAACSSDPEIDKAIEPVQVVEEEPAVVEPAEPAKPKYIMTVVASRGEDAITRALSVVGEGENMSVTSTWEENDVVTVYADNTVYGTLNPTEISDDGTQATFMGVLDVLPAEDAVLTLTYSGNDYSNQDGTLAGIDATCNYSVAENVKIAEYEENTDTGDVTIKTTAANFENQQFIAEFTLLTQDRSTSVATTELTITAGGQTITVTPTTATDKLYVAIPDFTGSISLTAKAAGTTLFEDSEVNYTFSIPSISDDEFENSTFYTIGVGLKKDVELGDPYYSDGTYAFKNRHAEGATLIGVVVYKDDPLTDDDNALTSNRIALVMALGNAANDVHWDDLKNKDEVLIGSAISSPALAFADYDGYTKTQTIINHGEGEGHYLAAHDAVAYSNDNDNVPAPPSTSTGWFLPSIGQWLAVLYGLGGADLTASTSWNFNSNVTIPAAVTTRITTAIEDAGGTTIVGDHFWSSSEYDAKDALHFDLQTTSFFVNQAQKIEKNNTPTEDVRSFLAF